MVNQKFIHSFDCYVNFRVYSASNWIYFHWKYLMFEQNNVLHTNLSAKQATIHNDRLSFYFFIFQHLPHLHLLFVIRLAICFFFVFFWLVFSLSWYLPSECIVCSVFGRLFFFIWIDLNAFTLQTLLAVCDFLSFSLSIFDVRYGTSATNANGLHNFITITNFIL